MPKLKPIAFNPSSFNRGSKIKLKYKALLLLFKAPNLGKYFRSLAIPLLMASV